MTHPRQESQTRELVLVVVWLQRVVVQLVRELALPVVLGEEVLSGTVVVQQKLAWLPAEVAGLL